MQSSLQLVDHSNENYNADKKSAGVILAERIREIDGIIAAFTDNNKFVVSIGDDWFDLMPDQFEMAARSINTRKSPGISQHKGICLMSPNTRQLLEAGGIDTSDW